MARRKRKSLGYNSEKHNALASGAAQTAISESKRAKRRAWMGQCGNAVWALSQASEHLGESRAHALAVTEGATDGARAYERAKSAVFDSTRKVVLACTGKRKKQ